jgi:hypothetical protein
MIQFGSLRSCTRELDGGGPFWEERVSQVLITMHIHSCLQRHLNVFGDNDA